MTDLKHTTPSKLLWLDFEMTGLAPQKDRIVEVAAILTDWNLHELGTVESGVRHDSTELKELFAENPWAVARPKQTQQLLDLSLNSPTEIAVESEILKLVDKHYKTNEPVMLAGNSIYFDRMFIRQWWPRLEARLHYRMLDVSAWKVVMQGRYDVVYKKEEVHRALDDIRESIDELKYYLKAVDAERL